MYKILLVDDDDIYREALKGVLESKFSVTTASNGKMAKEILTLTHFDLVLSDIQMPYFNGIDLLEWIKKYRKCKVILMTGFSYVLESKNAVDLGVDDLLAKPFTHADLFSKINTLLEMPEEKPKEEEGDVDNQYCHLPIEDFISQKETQFPVFIKLKSGKYVRLAHTGGKLSSEKIRDLKEKGLDYLYLRQEDFSKLVGFTLVVAKLVSRADQIEEEKKNRFIRYTGEMVTQQAFLEGINKETYENARSFLYLSIRTLSQSPDAFEMLKQLSNHSDYIYAHSLGVSLMSVLIAKKMAIQSPQILFKIAFAGLFHDIGKKEIPLEVLMKPRKEMNLEEIKLYESHPLRGKEILQTMRHAPEDVIRVCYEHHENLLGLGYPRRIRSNLHPLSHIVIAANTFCDYTIKSNPHHEVIAAHDAIDTITKFKKDELDPDCFEALKKVIGKKR